MRIDKEKLNDAMAAKGLFVRDLCKRLNMTEPTMKKSYQVAVMLTPGQHQKLLMC